MSCVPCPPGYACAFNTTLSTLAAARCSAGFYCPPGATSPIGAPVGHYVGEHGSTGATPCAPGMYADAIGATACTSCPAGHECPLAATIMPVSCAAGTYRDAASGSVRCDACAANSYFDGTGGTSSSVCVACEAGKVSAPGSSSAAACLPAGCEAKTASAGAAVVFVLVGALVGAGAMVLVWAIVPRRLQRTRVVPRAQLPRPPLPAACVQPRPAMAKPQAGQSKPAMVKPKAQQKQGLSSSGPSRQV